MGGLGGLATFGAYALVLAALERALEDAAEALRVMQEIVERAPARHLQAEGEQVLGGNVGVHRAQLRVEHHDAGGERIEQIRRIEVRERRRRSRFRRGRRNQRIHLFKRARKIPAAAPTGRK